MKNSIQSRWFVFALTIVFGCQADLVFGEARTLTNREGRQITVDLVGVSAGKVQAKRDGKPIEIPVASLSDDDVAFLRQWVQDNAPVSMRLSVFPKKGASPAQVLNPVAIPNTPIAAPRTVIRPAGPTNPPIVPEPGTTRISDSRSDTQTASTELEHFLIAVTNDSAKNLQDLKVDYRVFVSTMSDDAFGKTEKSIARIRGTIHGGTLGINETLELATGTIVLENKESFTTRNTTSTETVGGLNGPASFATVTRTTTETKKNRVRPKVEGIWLKIYEGKNMVEEYKKLSSKLEKDNVPWHGDTLSKLPDVGSKNYTPGASD